MRRFHLPSRQVSTAKREKNAKPRQILLVEDNPADAGLVREALEEYSVACELVVITNGERAIEFIKIADKGPAACPDLVILDLNLPRKAGQEVLACIRATRCRQTPVMVLTSSDSPKDREETARLGASRYFQKPSHFSEFLEMGSIFKTMLESSAD